MYFGLGTVLYVSLLLTNAVAILSHDRFLVPLGLHAGASSNHAPSSSGPNYGFDTYSGQIQGGGGGGAGAGGAGDGPGVKHRLVTLVGAVRTLMRIPLIPLNIVVIVYELLLG